MRDSDPPMCPRCESNRRMTRTGDEKNAGLKPDDVGYIAKVFYRCSKCRLRWIDAMDGTPLRMKGEARQRHG